MEDKFWLVNEIQAPEGLNLQQSVEAAEELEDGTRGPGLPRLSIKLRGVTCLDVQKWFGGAEVRLDALVIHGNTHKSGAQAESIYMPGTFRFPDMRDNVPLPIDQDFGLLIYDGTPAYFLDVFLIASRDRKDSDDLASLLKEKLNSDEVKGATAALLGLAVTVPTVAAVVAAVGAAAVLGNLAYQVVKAVSPKTIGMYRGSFLQFPDGFGLGRHPVEDQKQFVHGDLKFWFETVLNDEGKQSLGDR